MEARWTSAGTVDPSARRWSTDDELKSPWFEASGSCHTALFILVQRPSIICARQIASIIIFGAFVTAVKPEWQDTQAPQNGKLYGESKSECAPDLELATCDVRL